MKKSLLTHLPRQFPPNGAVAQFAYLNSNFLHLLPWLPFAALKLQEIGAVILTFNAEKRSPRKGLFKMHCLLLRERFC